MLEIGAQLPQEGLQESGNSSDVIFENGNDFASQNICFLPALSIRKQARLLDVPRTGLYYKPVINDDSEIANLIREVYLASDCRYGYRKVTAALHQNGTVANHKKVLRIMQEMGIEGLYPKRSINASISNLEHKTYPYLLKGLEINRINQVWATDISVPCKAA